MRTAVVLALALLTWLPARADDAEALERLLLGAGWSERGDLVQARRQFTLARGLADHNYLKIEALARSAGLEARNSAERASDVGLLMTYFRTTPPRFLSDEARKIIMETHAAQAESGLYEFLPPGPGVRYTEFGAGDLGSGFVGKRYHWVITLPSVPPPRVVDSDVPARMAEIQGQDIDRLGDPSQRLDLGGGRWALVDPRHLTAETPPDVRARWRFDRVAVGYTLEPVETELDELGRPWWKPLRPWYQDQRMIWALRFRIFWPSRQLGAASDLAPLAEDLLDALLRAHWLGREALGREATDPGGWPQVVDVWLTENHAEGWHDAGAERTPDGLVLYQASRERAPEEWLREAVHEYSHAMLPQLGRYAAESYEPWLDGPLGERLLLRLMARLLPEQPAEQLSNLLALVGRRRSLETYLAAQWDPLVDGWLAAGPTAAARSQLDDAGARWLLGLGCWIAETHEPAFVRGFWRSIRGRTQLTGESLQRWYVGQLRESQRWTYSARRPAGAADPARPPRHTARGIEVRDGVAAEYLIYLPRADWNLRVLCAAPGRVSVQVDDGEIYLVDAGDRLSTAKPLQIAGRDQWVRLRVGGFGANPAVLQSFHLSR